MIITRFLQSSFLAMLKLSPILYNAWLKAANKIAELCNFPYFNSNWWYSNKFSFKSFSKRCHWRRISDRQLNFCTWNILRRKAGGIHKYLNFRSFNNYTVDYYKEALKLLNFSNFTFFDDVMGSNPNSLRKQWQLFTKLLHLKITE